MNTVLCGFANPAVLENPYPYYKFLRETAPVYWEDSEQAWLVTRYHDVVSLLKEPSLSAAADVSFIHKLPAGVSKQVRPLQEHFKAWMVFSDDPLHSRLRTLTQSYLVPKAISRLREHLVKTAARLLDEAAEKQNIELLREYAIPLAFVALSRLIGLSNSDLANASRWSNELLDFINREPDSEQALQALQCLHELTAFVRSLRSGNKEPDPETLTCTLMRAHREARLDENEVVATLAQNITGALGPIPHIVTNGTLALLEHPTQLERLRRQPELSASAVEEFLRYDSPFLLVPRTLTAQLRLAGVEMEPGQRIALMLGAANHDPAVFPSPADLNISRHPNCHVAFGFGSHFCLGAPLTRLVGEVAISSLISRFSHIELRNPVKRMALFGMRGVQALNLTVRC